MSLSKLLNKNMDSNLRAMYELDYIDERLSLTPDGIRWMLDELLDMNIETLGKAATEELNEIKKEIQ